MKQLTAVISTGLGWFGLLALLYAAEPEAVPEPPQLPENSIVVDGEVIEPEVTIITRSEGTIYEYRINGHLYMAKVQPAVGPVYYLIDRDGDGEFDSRSSDPTSISVPQWLIMRW